jgi:hypothetical protein
VTITAGAAQESPVLLSQDSQSLTSLVIVRNRLERIKDAVKNTIIWCFGGCYSAIKRRIVESYCYERCINERSRKKTKKMPFVPNGGDQSTNREGPSRFGDDLSESERKGLGEV